MEPSDLMDLIIGSRYASRCVMAPTTRRKPSGRGGWRPGAGRKRELDNPVRATTVLEGSDFELLASIAAARGATVAAVIRDAVKALLKRHKRSS